MIDSEARNCYIYCYFRPNGTPCYIGKGGGGRNANRWRQHFKRSSDNNIHLRRIIAKAGGEVPHVKIRTGLTESESFEYEIAFIAAIGRGKNGPLVNMTDGGEGASGYIQSRESIAKRVAARRGKPGSMLGKKHSAETIEKMVQSQVGNKKRLGITHSEETKRKMSDTRKGRPSGRLGVAHTEETKEKIRAWGRGRIQAPEHTAAVIAAKRAKSNSLASI